MNIVLVSQEYPPETGNGGIATQTRIKAHALSQRGHTVTVVSHSVDEHRHDYADGAVRVVRIAAFDEQLQINSTAVQWLTYSALVAAEIDSLRRQFTIDVIDFPEYGAEAYVHLLNRAPWNRVPVIIHLHGPLIMLAHTVGWPELDSELYRLGTLMESASLRMADGVVSSSFCSADWCSRFYDSTLSEIPVIHTGVDTTHFSPRAVAKAERPTILFVGKLVSNKGIETLLDAALRLASEFPGLHLRVIGSGEEALIRRLNERVASSGVSELLELVGFVGREDLPEHYSRAHVFAAPSMYEGGPGFVYLEAMACGVPVVACAGSGAAEVVIPDVNGMLVPPNDIDALEHALRRLLSEPVLRNTLGEGARAYAVETSDSHHCMNRLEDFYALVHSRVISEIETEASGENG